MFSILFQVLSVINLSYVTKAGPTVRQDGLQVINNCYDNGQIALTFDDGPYLYEDQVAAAIDNYGGKATFFLNGNNYACIYDHYQTIQNLHAQGHTLGSHTWSHADLTTISDDQINQELDLVEQAFIKILGLKPLYFRPPYGSYNQNVLNILAQRGYKKVFLWSDATNDAVGASYQDQTANLDYVASQSPAPQLVLMHSPLDTSVDEAWYAAGAMNNAGYQMVAVDTCLGSDGEWPYVYVGEPQQPDGSWTC